MIRIIKKSASVTAALYGEIDHCSAHKMREVIEEAISESSVKELRLDFSHVTFMDSSGVGMLIGRYRTMKMREGSIAAFGLSAQMERLFRFAGLHRIIKLEEADKEAVNE